MVVMVPIRNAARVLRFLGYTPNVDFFAGEAGEQTAVEWLSLSAMPETSVIVSSEQDAIAYWQAVKAERIAAASDLADIKAQFASDRDKLQAIISAPGGTNANRDAQILDMAQIMRRLLKAAKAQAL